ncbi:TOMM precursor leader peptide-binding protein [Leeia sp.]|uniref:TOMM precursor leader peptide-binding protein n=1 Tax=Leeia sp. TaxID=2884678 RepID=UPI0035AFCC3C
MQDDMLFLSGGADEVYAVDEATPASVARQIADAWQQNTLHTLQDQAACQAALRQLRRVGAIVSPRAVQRPQRVALCWMGEACEPLMAALQRDGDSGLQWVAEPDQADTVLLIRSNASWMDCVTRYPALALQQPHLWVDIAYHHTLVIGPYVVPGETACIHCLSNRVAHRWGDVPLPASPQVQQHWALLAALILAPLRRQAGWAQWMEQSVSMDLTTLQTQRSTVYRLPWCPVCHGEVAAPLAAALPLPWIP